MKPPLPSNFDSEKMKYELKSLYKTNKLVKPKVHHKGRNHLAYNNSSNSIRENHRFHSAVENSIIDESSKEGNFQ